MSHFAIIQKKDYCSQIHHAANIPMYFSSHLLQACSLAKAAERSPSTNCVQNSQYFPLQK